MKRGIIMLAVGVCVAVASQPVSAAKLYKWVDESGNVTYQDSPPPEGIQVQERVIADPDAEGTETPAPVTDDTLQDAVATNPVVLYTAPDCAVCDLLITHLNNINVPFQGRNVVNDDEYQKELMAVAGKLEVPTLLIGAQVLAGFNQELINRELEVAGYPKDIDPDDSAAINDQYTADEELRQRELEQGVEDVVDEAEQSETEEALAESPAVDDLAGSDALDELAEDTFRSEDGFIFPDDNPPALESAPESN